MRLILTNKQTCKTQTKVLSKIYLPYSASKIAGRGLLYGLHAGSKTDGIIVITVCLELMRTDSRFVFSLPTFQLMMKLKFQPFPKCRSALGLLINA
jgi:hypothetical protein